MSLSSIAKKVSGSAGKYIGIGKKITSSVSSIAHKVATGAGVGAAGAAALGLAPVATALGAAAAGAKSVEMGANAIGAGLEKAEKVSGALRSGIERVKKAENQGGMMGNINMGRAAFDTLKSVRSAIR